MLRLNKMMVSSKYLNIYLVILGFLGILYEVNACGENYYLESGVFRSPYFPSTYSNNYHCVWTLHVPSHKRILLNVTHFQLESCYSCGCDYLIIRDGGTPRSPLFGVFCGYQLTGIHRSNSSSLQFEFITDGGTVRSGFEIYFHSIAAGQREEIPALTNHNEETTVKPGVTLYENKLLEWFLNLRMDESTVEKWKRQAPRIATALYCQDSSFFNVNNRTGDELRYEITIQALTQLSSNNEYTSQELAVHVNAMLVSCLNPRMFYGRNLVSELRRKVDKGSSINPYEFLVLCNAGDNMTLADVGKLQSSYKDSQQMPFWIGTQAIASMALTCILNRTTIQTDEAKALQVKMIQEIQAQQSENGSFGTLQETALSLQAIIAAGNLEEGFDLEAAIKSILNEQNVNGSFGSLLDSYYILPVLNHKSLVDIDTGHCNSYQNNDSKEASTY